MNNKRTSVESFDRLKALFFNNSGVSKLYSESNAKNDVLNFTLQADIELQTTHDVSSIESELKYAELARGECAKLKDMNIILNDLLDRAHSSLRKLSDVND